MVRLLSGADLKIVNSAYGKLTGYVKGTSILIKSVTAVRPKADLFSPMGATGYLGDPPTTVFDVTNSYEMAFVACAGLSVIALVLLAVLRFPKGRC